MPYAAPDPSPSLVPPPFFTAYPTPPPSPLSGLCTLEAVFWSESVATTQASAPRSADPLLAAVESLPPRVNRSKFQSQPPPHRPSALRLCRPRGILAVLGGVRVLSINTTSVLDRMPYAAVKIGASADTDVVDALLASEKREQRAAALIAKQTSDDSPSSQHAAAIAAEAVRIGTGVLSLRRAQSESTVHQLSSSKTMVPTVALPTVSESANSSSSILIQPPTPVEQPVPAPGPSTPPGRSLPTSPSADPSTPTSSTSRTPRPPPRLTSRSPRSGSVTPNVLPEVRSPRRTTETLQTRRSRRPRLFGFTGLVDDASSTTSSAASSPKGPLSPTESTTQMLPRRSPSRTRSETSLANLPLLSATVVAPRSASHPQPMVIPTATATVPTATSPLIHISPTHTAAPFRETGLKLDLGNIVPQPNPDLPLNAGIVHSPFHSVIKKKSGEIVKSALKYSGPLLENGTPREEKPNRFAGSRSCPTTPSCPKYVHFDAQLERIKLFLQDQKPQVVSLQGSPTDMSEDEDEPEKKLTVRLPNFPTSLDYDSNLFIESLYLNEDRDALRGMVRVKNFSFEKWVAVRFTFDWWQTTSEVTATYKESIRGGAYDRFQFTIKLHDLLDRIEEKSLFLCVRYNTDGQEFWDSNGNSNYTVLFERKAEETRKFVPKRSRGSPAPGMGRSVNRNGSPWSVKGADADRMADLRAKLNRLTAEDNELSKPLASVKRSPRPTHLRLPTNDGMSSLSGRYDFGSALKSSPQPAKREFSGFYSPRPGFGLPVSPNGTGSPNGLSPNPGSPFPPSPLPGPPSPLPPALTFASTNSSSTVSLDSVAATPADSPSLLLSRELDDVTPSDTTDSPNSSASSTVSPSPSDSPMSPTSVFPWSPHSGKDRSADDMSLASYSSFIEQFCWAGGEDFRPGVRRIHSTSSLDHLSTTSFDLASPPDMLTPRAYTPTPTHGLSRSASTNGTASTISGTSTSTASVTTPNGTRRASPPTREDLEHVDNAIRSLSNSLASTAVSGSPHTTPPHTPMMRPSGSVLAL